jgi:hypothetical protein
MGHSNFTYSTSTQNVTNDLLQQMISSSSATCTNVNSNNDIVVNGATGGNNSTLSIASQTCNTSLQTIIDNTQDAQTSNVLQAMQEANQKTISSPISFNFNSNADAQTMVENISNHIQQVSISSCNYSTTNIIENDIAVVTNVHQGDNSKLEVMSQSGDVGGTCYLTNASNMIANNQAKAAQKTTQSQDSIFTMLIILAIVIAVVVGVIIAIFVYNYTKPGKNGQSQLSQTVASLSSNPALLPEAAPLKAAAALNMASAATSAAPASAAPSSAPRAPSAAPRPARQTMVKRVR